MMPTVAPVARSASARFTATVDLPTPPLPEDTAMVWRTSGMKSAPFAGAGGACGAACAWPACEWAAPPPPGPIFTCTLVTPASWPTIFVAMLCTITLVAGGCPAKASVKLTCPS
jgi:hypothetical protein